MQGVGSVNTHHCPMRAITCKLSCCLAQCTAAHQWLPRPAHHLTCNVQRPQHGVHAREGTAGPQKPFYPNTPHKVHVAEWNLPAMSSAPSTASTHVCRPLICLST